MMRCAFSATCTLSARRRRLPVCAPVDQCARTFQVSGVRELSSVRRRKSVKVSSGIEQEREGGVGVWGEY